MTLQALSGTSVSRTAKIEWVMRNGNGVWKRDLKNLFDNAKDRYPDIVWEVRNDDDTRLIEIWGHKAMIYARATPGFHLRHFSEIIDTPSQDINDNPVTATSQKALVRRATPYRSTLFREELQEIYTGEGYDVGRTPVYRDASERLKEDLLFMWRTRLYSDVKIQIHWTGLKTNNPVIFHAHRFILVSRSPHFASLLARDSADSRNPSPTPDNPLDISFHSPPFNADSFKLILEFIYTGALRIVANSEFDDLTTALSIWHGSLYFKLPSLQKLICSHIIQKMLHGLCHAYLDDKEYEKLVGNSWTAMVRQGGCACPRCKEWAPQLLKFAMDSRIQHDELERGVLRALTRLFGLGWCTIQFASLPQKMLDYILLIVHMTIITPRNALCLLFAAKEALSEIQTQRHDWLSTSRSAIMKVRDWIDDILCKETEDCLRCEEWAKIREDDALGITSNSTVTENSIKLPIIRDAIFRAVGPDNAANIYKVLDHYANLPAKSQSWIRAYIPVNSVLQVHLYQIKLGIRNVLEGIPLSPGFEKILKNDERYTYEQYTFSRLKDRERFSVYSHLSEVTRPLSIAELQDISQHPDIDALDLANISLYSRASSRTASTDYGLFYTRRAYSQDSLDTMTIRESRAWSSLSVRDEVRNSIQSI